ncbi:hypothetical protein ccbrp13_71540 [Ktedonobacteria bacterium brp13]|nr:hypothetical protein ccbrp13_71540 [Ktedonobacteria bacterium brp13]
MIAHHVHGSPEKGTVSRIVLFLYDSKRHLIYNSGQNIPTYVDFHVDELIPYKDSGNVNYVPVEQEQSR